MHFVLLWLCTSSQKMGLLLGLSIVVKFAVKTIIEFPDKITATS